MTKPKKVELPTGDNVLFLKDGLTVDEAEEKLWLWAIKSLKEELAHFGLTGQNKGREDVGFRVMREKVAVSMVPIFLPKCPDRVVLGQLEVRGGYGEWINQTWNYLASGGFAWNRMANSMDVYLTEKLGDALKVEPGHDEAKATAVKIMAEFQKLPGIKVHRVEQEARILLRPVPDKKIGDIPLKTREARLAKLIRAMDPADLWWLQVEAQPKGTVRWIMPKRCGRVSNVLEMLDQVATFISETAPEGV